MAMMLLISCLAAVSGVSSSPRALRPRISGTAGTEEACPPCELLFSKLERTGKKGKLSQHIRVQERGEPKSGTGVAYFWATAGLIHACHYLEEHFGEVAYIHGNSRTAIYCCGCCKQALSSSIEVARFWAMQNLIEEWGFS